MNTETVKKYHITYPCDRQVPAGEMLRRGFDAYENNEISYPPVDSDHAAYLLDMQGQITLSDRLVKQPGWDY